tara:strand:- start:338 stop:1060 length:723 start_codon:yes stop_codon:yes gene_type:complete
MIKKYFYVALILLLPTPVFGEGKIIELSVPDDNQKKSLLVSKSEGAKHPAIVYMHGGIAREESNFGYFEDKVLDFAAQGFVILAPLRNTPPGCCNGDDAIKEGIRVANSAAKYLKSLPNVSRDKICLVGFSEGALISAWAMTEPNDFSSAIIMSSSNQCGMQRAGAENYCGKHLGRSGKLQKVKKQVIITLGNGDKRPHARTAEGFSRKLSTEIKVFDGDHRSFMKPRDDVNALLKKHCS